MKRLSKLTLPGLVFGVFALLSISDISLAGQFNPGAFSLTAGGVGGGRGIMVASYEEAPAGTISSRSIGKNGPAAESGVFLTDSAAGGARSDGFSSAPVFNNRTFDQSVSAYPYVPSNLQNSYKLEPYRSGAFDFEFTSVLKGARRGKVVDIGAAFATNVLVHELGHAIVADYVGADGSTLGFLQSKDGQFFFASSTVRSIDADSRLPYYMGGEFATDFTFEYALGSYRKDPTLYNRSLMFFSGTEMLWYSLYAFYLSGGNDNLDPIAVTKYGGVSREAVLSVALAKTVMNAYRIYSGKDTVIPHFMVDNDSVTLNLTMAF